MERGESCGELSSTAEAKTGHSKALGIRVSLHTEGPGGSPFAPPDLLGTLSTLFFALKGYLWTLSADSTDL